MGNDTPTPAPDRMEELYQKRLQRYVTGMRHGKPDCAKESKGTP
jgi:hypothetical protein